MKNIVVISDKEDAMVIVAKLVRNDHAFELVANDQEFWIRANTPTGRRYLKQLMDQA